MLYTEKVPFIVTFVLAILGWQIVQMVEDSRRGRAILYDVSYTGSGSQRRVDVEIHNVSREKMVGNVQFMLVCDGKADCYPRSNAFRIKAIAPNLPIDTAIHGDGGQQQFYVTLAADGATGLNGPIADGRSASLYFVPQEGGVAELYMVDKDSIRGIVMRVFSMEGLFLSMIGFAVATMLVFGINGWLARARKGVGAEPAAPAAAIGDNRGNQPAPDVRGGK